jgi:hypothetical protein
MMDDMILDYNGLDVAGQRNKKAGPFLTLPQLFCDFAINCSPHA